MRPPEKKAGRAGVKRSAQLEAATQYTGEAPCQSEACVRDLKRREAYVRDLKRREACVRLRSANAAGADGSRKGICVR